MLTHSGPGLWTGGIMSGRDAQISNAGNAALDASGATRPCPTTETELDDPKNLNTARGASRGQPRREWRDERDACKRLRSAWTPPCPARSASTIPPRSTIPAASASSPICTTARATRSCEKGLQILINLDHRGATGADETLGDGCGVLTQIPHGFFAEECAKLGFTLPAPGHYAIGQFFMPRDAQARAQVEKIVEEAIAAEGQKLLGWRDVPVDNAGLWARASRRWSRCIGRCSSAAAPASTDEDTFERRVFLVRKVVSNRTYEIGGDAIAEYYPVSMSCRTIVYKGMVLVQQLGPYYRDLLDPRFETALALVHQRFATNTFPSWRLAHPYRMVAHNGEINTLRGNVNWMAARQANVDSELFGNDISKLWPISYEGQSDTACFDNALEFLVRGGYSLTHAMMMLIPEAWAGNPLMSEERRAFYEYHAAIMEPWDGPAAMAFTDGRQIGATLDRNGLRPARYFVTDDGLVVLASEMGVLPVPEESIVQKWRLQPGKMLLVDLEQHRIVSDDELKASLSQAHPYREWLDRTQIVLEELNPVEPRASRTDVSLLDRQQAFGYSQEDLAILMAPMAATGQEAVGSMGTDTPISALSGKVEAALHLFQAELRAGHQPADRPDPRGTGDEPRLVHRAAAEPARSRRRRQAQAARGAPADPDQRGSRKDPLHRPFRGYVRHQDHRHHLCGRARRARAWRTRCAHLRARRGAVVGGYNIIILSRPHGRAGPHSDPVAARDRRRASSSDPQGPAHLRRPRRRDRRRARGASLRVSGRLRRRGDQPLSRLRDAGGDGRRNCRRRSRPTRRSSASSSRSTRAF